MQTTPDITETDPLLRSEAVAEYIDVSMATLEKWRNQKRGPAHVRIGRLVRYRQSDLDRWLREQTVSGDAA
jgi:excisionase family DNA binding protein